MRLNAFEIYRVVATHRPSLGSRTKNRFRLLGGTFQFELRLHFEKFKQKRKVFDSLHVPATVARLTNPSFVTEIPKLALFPPETKRESHLCCEWLSLNQISSVRSARQKFSLTKSAIRWLEIRTFVGVNVQVGTNQKLSLWRCIVGVSSVHRAESKAVTSLRSCRSGTRAQSIDNSIKFIAKSQNRSKPKTVVLRSIEKSLERRPQRRFIYILHEVGRRARSDCLSSRRP